MEKYSEVFPLRVTSKMYGDIKKLAEKEYLTISQWLRRLIREEIEKNGKVKHGK